MAFTLILLLVFTLILGIPIGLSYLIYRYIRKKGYHRRFRLIALIPVFILGCFIYISIFPPDNFYKEDFVEVTGMSFPENTTIGYKRATFPDHFGDYTSVFVVKIDSSLYFKLPNKLITRGFSEIFLDERSREFKKIRKSHGEFEITREFNYEEGGGVDYYVGFLNNKQSIIVQRISW